VRETPELYQAVLLLKALLSDSATPLPAKTRRTRTNVKMKVKTKTKANNVYKCYPSILPAYALPFFASALVLRRLDHVPQVDSGSHELILLALLSSYTTTLCWEPLMYPTRGVVY